MGGGSGEGGCERRIEVFVNIQKKNFFLAGGSGGGGGGGGGSGGHSGEWLGWGGGGSGWM